MNIATAYNWQGFNDIISGDGTLSISGALLTCASGLNTGSSRVDKYLKLFPGDKVKVTCFARRVSGSDATSGGIAINYPVLGTTVNRVRITSSDWMEYSTEFSVPLNASSTSYVLITLGVFTADAGQVQFLYPQISLQNSTLGAPRIFCHGVFTVNAGTPSVNETYSHSGILGVSYSAGTSTLTITMAPGVAGTLAANPIFFAQMSPEPGTGGLVLVPRAGTFNAAAGTVQVKFIDSTAGTIEEISTYGLFYFSFLAMA